MHTCKMPAFDVHIVQSDQHVSATAALSMWIRQIQCVLHDWVKCTISECCTIDGASCLYFG